jgi:hypothetical protein
MRADEKIRWLCLAVVFTFLWASCAGAPAGKRDPYRLVCVKDRDCQAGFCDRGTCVELTGGKTSYGWACNSSPLAGSPDAGQPDSQCGGYLCVGGQCRSCTSNADCAAYFGAGQCSIVTGPNTLPGAVCWPMAAVIADYASGRTDLRDVCVKDPADAPGEKRFGRGVACVRDCDCLSSFCDRGTCADSADLGAGNYGRGPCKPTTPSGLVPGLRSSIEPDFCGGYVCVEQRCRSCQSDAECREGSSESRCLSFRGSPGKQCEDPNELSHHPDAPQPRRKHEPDAKDMVISVPPPVAAPPPAMPAPPAPTGSSPPSNP